MPKIQVLDEQTIDQIAAGEVVERPSSVVKELVENAIDAKASAITVEIKEGGMSLIRITDNGQGIPKEQVPTAFLRHATSKILTAQDLLSVGTLGFRGEALSSIAAVAQVEVITKISSELAGTRYVIEGSKEVSVEEIGAPNGTTLLVKNLFYNTPARKKFLKSPQTEATYINAMMEHLALSRSDISFQLIVNNQPKLHTNGNSNLLDIIYHIYGRDIANALLPVHYEHELFRVDGYVGKPQILRGNRNFETYFINGRYIKNSLVTKSIEDAYQGYQMKRQYPFTVLLITMEPELIDVNVHPAKLEVRFKNGSDIYQALTEAVRSAIEHKDIIPQVKSGTDKTGTEKKKQDSKQIRERSPEPFEKKRLEAIAKAVQKDSPYEPKYNHVSIPAARKHDIALAGQQSIGNNSVMQSGEPVTGSNSVTKSDGAGIGSHSFLTSGESETADNSFAQSNIIMEETQSAQTDVPGNSMIQPDPQGESDNQAEVTYLPQEEDGQLSLAESGSYHVDFIQQAKRRNYTMIGQLFHTYWLVQVEDELFIIDQHAAHEKVLYEQMMQRLSEKEFTSQQVSPPVVITMTMQEEALFHQYEAQFTKIGFEVESFGGKEYSIRAVPADLYQLDSKQLFLDMLDGLSADSGRRTPELILEKIASMSCKAAVKGRQHISRAEAETLIDDLLKLENPYNCPHGRPTIVALSRTEIEKMFKRIV